MEKRNVKISIMNNNGYAMRFAAVNIPGGYLRSADSYGKAGFFCPALSDSTQFSVFIKNNQKSNTVSKGETDVYCVKKYIASSYLSIRQGDVFCCQSLQFRRVICTQ